MRTDSVQHVQPGHTGRVLPISVLPAADPVQQLGPKEVATAGTSWNSAGGNGVYPGTHPKKHVEHWKAHGFSENDLDMVVNFYSFDGF